MIIRETAEKGANPNVYNKRNKPGLLLEITI